MMRLNLTPLRGFFFICVKIGSLRVEITFSLPLGKAQSLYLSKDDHDICAISGVREPIRHAWPSRTIEPQLIKFATEV